VLALLKAGRLPSIMPKQKHLSLVTTVAWNKFLEARIDRTAGCRATPHKDGSEPEHHHSQRQQNRFLTRIQRGSGPRWNSGGRDNLLRGPDPHRRGHFLRGTNANRNGDLFDGPDLYGPSRSPGRPLSNRRLSV
jgi:hypothetical protein